MKRFLGWLDRRWYLFLAGGCIGAELLVFLIFRENSYFTVQDNLDLFGRALSGTEPLKQLVCTRRDGSDAGRISRDSLSSEWNLYNILYTFMPVFWAYLTGYFLKILIGTGSFVLLAKDVYQKTYPRYRGIAWAAGLCYGLLPLFPAYGIAFASIPLAVFILRRIYRKEGKWWYALLFVYPFLFVFFLLRIFPAGISGVCGCDCVDSRQKILRSSGSRCAGAGGWLCLL